MGLGAAPFPLPLHFGHECVAEVVEVAAGVSAVRPGQRVVVPFQISCGDCEPCRERAAPATAPRCRRSRCTGSGSRAGTGAAPSPICSPCPSPRRCWCRSPTESSRRPSPAPPTTSPTPTGGSRPSWRQPGSRAGRRSC
ncbi:MAG: alcohol dehydrogenase catalytic domain-containing protein [Solirubrobacterales bacterium]